jgi:hypothetical protein
MDAVGVLRGRGSWQGSSCWEPYRHQGCGRFVGLCVDLVYDDVVEVQVVTELIEIID